MFGKATIYASKLSDIPSEPHFVILKQSSHYTPGDERSKTNPGHGYPESNDPYLQYEAYKDFTAWEEEITNLLESKSSFRALIVQIPVIEATIKVLV